MYLDNGKLPSDSNPLPTKFAGTSVKLLNSKATTGIGTTQAIGSYKMYSFEVWGTASSYAIQIQAVGPSGVARNLKVWDELNNAFISGNVTAAGFYSVTLPQFTTLQANVVSVTGGNVSVEGGIG